MSRISSCAACHGDILIPGFAQPHDQMRCPLCHAQFRVQDVLATSILAPPEALPVERPIAGLGAAPRHAPGAGIAQFDDESHAAPRPRKKQSGVLSQLIGIVGGGLIGLSLGYVGLLRLGGPQYDFLEVADKLPAWATAPIDLPFWPKAKDEEPRNDRGLGQLLNEPEPPPAGGLNGDAGGIGTMPEAPPAEPNSEAPPFAPAAAAPPPPFTSTSVDPPLGETHEVPADAGPAPGPRASAPADQPPPLLGEMPNHATQPLNSGPRHFTAYSGEDLSLAINEVTASLRCPACNGEGYVQRSSVLARDGKGARAEPIANRRVQCDVCGGRPIAKITPELYSQLCHLAEVVTFVSKGDGNSWSQRETLQTLIANVGSDPKAAEAVGRLAGFQLEHNRHPNPGIALAGTVQEMSQVGSLHAMKVVLFGLPKVVTVISWRPAQPAINVHDRVMILGSIVDNPVENLAGYEGRQDQVVWGGLPAKLPLQP